MDKSLIKIRKAKKEDANGWFVLINRVWRDAYNQIFPEEVFSERDRQLAEMIKSFSEKAKNDDKYIAYVAEYDGEIIGIMRGSINSNYEHFSMYADLIALYIDPRFQGYGIGHKFRELFEAWAIKNGASKYVIGVLKDNLKARTVYESWGGKLADYEQAFVRCGIPYPEVFYTYDLNKEEK